MSLRLHLTLLQWLKIARGLGFWSCFNCIGCSSVKIFGVSMNARTYDVERLLRSLSQGFTVTFVGQNLCHYCNTKNIKKSGPLFRRLLSSLYLWRHRRNPCELHFPSLPHVNIDSKEIHEKSIILFKRWFRSENINKFDFLPRIRTLGLLQSTTNHTTEPHF